MEFCFDTRCSAGNPSARWMSLRCDAALAVSVLKALIFDFDGVIFESVDIKTRAFREIFKNHPEHLDRITRRQLSNGG